MSSFRTVLIWLLMLAVPAQAVTAATMAFCGASHGGDSAQAWSAGAPAQHPGGADQRHAGHLHTMAHQADASGAAERAQAADTAQAAAKAGPAAQGDQPKCSACASCCSLAVMPNIVLAVPQPDFTTTVFSTVVPSVGAFATDGPDRPPRPALH